MQAAAVVTILAVVVVVAVLVIYLVAVILELRKISGGLDVVVGRVGEIVRKSAPVNDIVADLNNNLDRGRDLLEYLLDKKAGVEDAAGLVESVFPGAGAAVLERHGRRGQQVRNIDVVYTRGADQLARLGRESPLGAPMSGAALRDAASSSAAARTIYHRPYPDRARPRSPTIGTGAPVQYSPDERAGQPAGSEASESQEESAPSPPPSAPPSG